MADTFLLVDINTWLNKSLNKASRTIELLPGKEIAISASMLFDAIFGCANLRIVVVIEPFNSWGFLLDVRFACFLQAF